MAERSDYLITILVKAINQAGNFGDKVAGQVDKIVGAESRQQVSARKTKTSVEDLDKAYRKHVEEIGRGAKSYDDAQFGLKRLSAEMDKLARQEPIGSPIAESLNRSAVAARGLSDQLRQAHETESKLADQEARDRVRRETDRQRLTEQTVRAEQAAEAAGAKNRRGLLEEVMDEVRRDHSERLHFAKELADAEVKEAVRVEEARQASRSTRPDLSTTISKAMPTGGSSTTGFSTDGAPFMDRLQRAPAARTTFIDRMRSALSGLSRDEKDAERSTSSLDRATSRLGGTMDRSHFSIAKVDNNLRGLMVIGVIAFSQQLISAMVGLAGAAAAVASSAVQAGAALGGAFAAGAAQAIPMIGLLISAFGRIGAVFDAVKLFNQQAMKSGFDQAQVAGKQADAADRITSAQEGVASATQRVQEATDALTDARERALRNIQDLDLAERRASRGRFDAATDLQRAASRGDVGALEGLQIQKDSAGLDASRATKDAGQADRAGVDRSAEVKQAEQSLHDSNVALERARRELDAAQRSAVNAAKTSSAADRSLEQALAQLTPAELALYESAKRIQVRFKTIFRPITDIIVTAFSGAVDRVSKIMGDGRIVGPVTRIAKQLADSIGRFTRFLTDAKGLDFFKRMGDESAHNIPLLTTLGIRLAQIFRNIADAGSPALRRFIKFFVDLATQGERATGSKSGLQKLRRFFLDGEKMAESFTKLGIAVAGLFLAIIGQGGAKEGKNAIDDLTAAVKRMTNWVNNHGPEVRKFFSNAIDVAEALAGSVAAIGKAMAMVFNPDKVKNLTDAFNTVLLPALTTTVSVLGNITDLMTKFLSLPGVSQLATFALSVTLVGKAVSTFGNVLKLVFGSRMAEALAKLPLLGVAFEGLGASMGAAATFMTGPWGVAIAAVLVTIALLDQKFHFLGPTFKWLKGAFKDVVDWLKNAAGDVVHFFDDSWNKGLLYVLKQPFMLWLDFQKLIWGHIIDFLSGSSSKVSDIFTKGPFAVLAKLLSLPFRLGWELVQGIVTTALDLIRGDFSGAKDDFVGIFKSMWRIIGDLFKSGVDVALGALTTLLGGLSSVGSVVGDLHIPVVSGLFKSVADAIDGARDKLDSYRESLREVNKEHEKTGEVFTATNDRITALKAELLRLDKGSDEYRKAARSLRVEQRVLNETMSDAEEKGKKGARGPRAIGASARSAAAAVDDANKIIVGGYNKLGEQLGGIKKLTYAGVARVAILGDDPEKRATGGYGWIGGRRGGPQGPDNRHVLAGDGEAFLAVNQQGPVDEGLALRSMVRGGPSNLDELFSKVRGRVGAFATGGRVDGLKTGIAALVGKILGRFPGLSVTSTTGGTHAPNSWHYKGMAADIGGAPMIMNRAAVWLSSNAKALTEGIHNPGLSVKDGHQVPSSFWGSTTWAGHADHIHVAVAGALMKLLGEGSLKTPKISGPAGIMRSIAQRAVSRIASAAREKLSSSGPVEDEGSLPSGPWKNILSKIADMKHWSVPDWLWVIGRESGGNTNAKNPRSTAFGLGQLLDFNYKKYGGGPGSSGAEQVRAMAGYLSDRYGNPTAARRYWEAHNSYANGGELPGPLGRAVPILAHAKEWVLNEGQKNRLAGWMGVGVDKLRGMLGLSVGGSSAASGTEVKSPKGTFMVPTIIDQSEVGVSTEIRRAQTAIRRMKLVGAAGLLRFTRSLEQITDDGGLIDQGLAAIQRVFDRVGTRLKKVTYSVGKSGAVRRLLSPAQQNAASLGVIDDQIGGLKDLRGVTSSSLKDVDRRLAPIRKGGVSKKEQNNYEALIFARRALVDKIDDLDSGIADAIESRFAAQEQVLQDAIDQVTSAGQRALTRADLGDRVAALVQGAGDAQTAFAIRGSDIRSRISSQTSQRDALAPLLAQAQAQGSTQIAEDLVGQIEELNVSIAENVSALGSNTVAARQAAIDSISGRGSFLGGVFSNLGSIVQTIGAITGSVDVAQLVSLAKQGAQVLAQTGEGLKQQLLQGYGVDLVGRTGQGLVDALRGLNFDGIEASFTAEQRQQFEALIAAIIDNEGALQQSTQQIQDLSSTQEQSLSTTAWQLFRQAIFDGSGGLLPAYNIPMMSTGGGLMSGGITGGSATAISTRSSTQVGGDHIEVNVTSPTEVLDPTYLADVISFRRSTERSI